MITRAFFLTFLLLLNYSSQSISSENEPLRITIHPTIINENVVGSSTTIINNKTIRENSHLSLGSLLSRFSGINFENLYSGVDVKSSVKIRGFGEQASRNVLVLLNGIRISDMTIAGANLSRVPIESIYKIEIIKGGTASVLFGDGAGAVIIEATETPGILSTHIHADGNASELLKAEMPTRGKEDSVHEAWGHMEGNQVSGSDKVVCRN